jgi:hypothetical protein
VETVGERPGKRANRWNFNVVRVDGANDAATTLALNSLESSAERDLWVGAAQRALNPPLPMSAADPLKPTSLAGPGGQQQQGMFGPSFVAQWCGAPLDLVGCVVEVRWDEHGRKVWYKADVTEYIAETGRHKTVYQDDGEEKLYNMSRKHFRIVQYPQQHQQLQQQQQHQQQARGGGGGGGRSQPAAAPGAPAGFPARGRGGTPREHQMASGRLPVSQVTSMHTRNICKFFLGMRLQDFGPSRTSGTVTSIMPNIPGSTSGPGRFEVTHDAAHGDDSDDGHVTKFIVLQDSNQSKAPRSGSPSSKKLLMLDGGRGRAVASPRPPIGLMR